MDKNFKRLLFTFVELLYTLCCFSFVSYDSETSKLAYLLNYFQRVTDYDKVSEKIRLMSDNIGGWNNEARIVAWKYLVYIWKSIQCNR